MCGNHKNLYCSIDLEKSVIASSGSDDADSCKNNNEFSQEIMLKYYKNTKNCDSSEEDSNCDEHELNQTKAKRGRKRNCQQKDKRLKTNEEIAILEAYFKNDPAWGRRTVKELKTQLPTLTVDQIYKWGYDRKLLLKKQIAKQKMKFDFEANNRVEVDLNLLAIQVKDYNKEVENLCNFHMTSSKDHEKDEYQNKQSINLRKLKYRKNASSINCKETLLTSEQNELLTDDPYFYSSTDDSFFYVVNKDSKNTIPHRVVGKRGLFRIPSGFFNLDFYTYKEEAFKDGTHEFLSELKGAE